jgi:hypothetical protein
MLQSCNEVSGQIRRWCMGYAQDTVRAKGDVDGREMNILAFVFRGRCGLQGVDLFRHK